MATDTIHEIVRKNTNNEDSDMERLAGSIIQKYTLVAAGGGLVPYDYVDVLASTASQTMMVRELCKLYDVSFSEKWINVVLWSAAGTAITKALVEVIETILLKTGNKPSFDLTAAAVAAIYTSILGEFYRLHLDNGGTLQDVSVGEFVEHLVREIKDGDLSLATFTNPKTLMNQLNLI